MRSSRRQPAEWAPHEAVWIGWPSAADLWEENLEPAQGEVAALVKAVAFPGGADGPRGERVELLVRGEKARAAAEAMRGRLPDSSHVRIHEAPIGDVWLRDTGPIFTLDEAGRLCASAFRFNGWGGKYDLPHDDEIARIIADLARAPLSRFDRFVGEGGALEPDGEGTVITTRQCLLNPNRNPGLSEKEIEEILKIAIGAEKVIWLDEGLVGDHTDGHVDNLARFISPGRVVCMRPYGEDDPNRQVLDAIRKRLAQETDAGGRRLEVVEIPSSGLALIDDEPAPASHMNFYIANHSLVLPTYVELTGKTKPAEEALAILETAVTRAYARAIDSSRLLTGGGSFHCISQQQPRA